LVDIVTGQFNRGVSVVSLPNAASYRRSEHNHRKERANVKEIQHYACC